MERPQTRQEELERLYNARKSNRHGPQISISDPNAHVTDAFSSYYGNDDSGAAAAAAAGGNTLSAPHDSRPLSFINAPSEKESYTTRRQGSIFDHDRNRVTQQSQYEPRRTSPPRVQLDHAWNKENPTSPTDGSSKHSSPTSLHRAGSAGTEHAQAPRTPPPLSRQASSETAVQSFPLNDIDYESSPAAVAQELSNLQAIRRMSMNVDAADPDLPSFGGAFSSIPTVAPKGSEVDENDPSKLFWVPARLHPELAPKEFKTLFEDKVERIRRRSGGEDTGFQDGLERHGSGGSLGRKKSMLSHQIDTKGAYEDGADRLERKRSRGMQVEGQARVANLSELEELVNDPSQLIRRMSIDTVRRSQDSAIDVPANEDMPILPPVGTLKRSTRTTYRRGSLKKGERVPFSKRAQQRQVETDHDEASSQYQQQPDSPATDEPSPGLTRAQTEPVLPPNDQRDHFSRPGSRRRHGVGFSHSSEDLVPEHEVGNGEPDYSPLPRQTERHSEPARTQHTQSQQAQPQPRQFQSRIASSGRTTAQLPGYTNNNPLPHIIETLPDGTKVPVNTLNQNLPERRSSHDVPRQFQRGAHTRPAPGRQKAPSSTLDDISSHPSPLPGSSNTRTDALTLVPTYDEKSDQKESSKKSGWKWILGTDDGSKSKKSRDDNLSDSASAKSKAGRLAKSQADKARLDVLQNSIDGTVPPRGRESLVLNRDELRLDEGTKSQGKKSLDPPRKEKDGLLSAIFGGKKKSSDGELKEKKRKSDRGLSPDPTPRFLKPDIDYNWTRFSILEERAIYRMAHIKLANPRRALYSQVLLSNFMYSYLAKVQMMHPQIQIPAAQRAAQQRGQKAEDTQQQPAEYNQYQRWQEQQERQDAAASAMANQDGTSDRSSFEVEASSPRMGYDHGAQSSSGYDQRGSDDYDQHSYNSQQGYPKTNGASSYGYNSNENYSVAGTHDYLGYPKAEQPFGQQGLWDDDERTEELW